ncbi:hypothetical protein D3C77_479680 [compost metagenome]
MQVYCRRWRGIGDAALQRYRLGPAAEGEARIARCRALALPRAALLQNDQRRASEAAVSEKSFSPVCWAIAAVTVRLL